LIRYGGMPEARGWRSLTPNRRHLLKDLSGSIERRGRVPIKHAAQPEEDLVRLYLNDIGKYGLLTKDAEARLAQAVEAGRQARGELAGAAGISPSRQLELRRLIRDGDQATETFVKANLRLVVSIAKTYQAAGLPCSTWFRRATWA
jgi:DNA-directed RNA polymerase sigma subunit (sigma70/sigma32)